METQTLDDMHILTHNGVVTVASPTGEHRTFKIHTQKKDARFAPGQRIVSLLTGPNNEADYESFGFVNRRISLFKKKRTPQYIAYVKLLTHPRHYEDRGMEYLWEGRCRVCNRKLTTPESIKSGIGPVCAGRVS